MKLAEELDQYDLRPEIAGPWDYAEARTRERCTDLPAALLQSLLFQTRQATQAGQEMMEQENAAMTDYGLIRRKDGQPLPELRQEAGGMTQRME